VIVRKFPKGGFCKQPLAKTAIIGLERIYNDFQKKREQKQNTKSGLG
jgi:hypothetical protein